MEFSVVAKVNDVQVLRILAGSCGNNFNDGLGFVNDRGHDDDADVKEFSGSYESEVVAPSTREAHEGAVVVPAFVGVAELLQLGAIL